MGERSLSNPLDYKESYVKKREIYEFTNKWQKQSYHSSLKPFFSIFVKSHLIYLISFEFVFFSESLASENVMDNYLLH